MAAAAVPLAVAAVGAGVSLYEGEQSRKAMPKPPTLPDVPKLPDTKPLATSLAEGEIQARTAGGTILSDQRQNQQIGDNANGVRKSLLGT